LNSSPIISWDGGGVPGELGGGVEEGGSGILLEAGFGSRGGRGVGWVGRGGYSCCLNPCATTTFLEMI
jgi:hypothetical protein